jgi:hypothetical protein
VVEGGEGDRDVMEVQVIIEEGLLVLLNGYWLYIAVD